MPALFQLGSGLLKPTWHRKETVDGIEFSSHAWRSGGMLHTSIARMTCVLREVLFRQEERDMHSKHIERVLGLGPNLFYHSPRGACVVVCR